MAELRTSIHLQRFEVGQIDLEEDGDYVKVVTVVMVKFVAELNTHPYLQG